MSVFTLFSLLVLTAGPKPETTAADVLTLRNGQAVSGQVAEPAPRGKLAFIVRRAWLKEHAPDLAKQWAAAETPVVNRARMQRVNRLVGWRRERVPTPGENDPILSWLDAEIDRLKALGDAPSSTPLMLVTLNRGDVKTISRRSKDAARMLRQGWRARFDGVEEIPSEDLKSSLQGRGFAMSNVDQASVDRLLPIPLESENHWRLRRAATEEINEPALRFLRYQGLLLPEMTPGAAPDAKQLVGALASLLGGQPNADPLRAQARQVEARGRIAMGVTTLNMAPDGSAVTVDATLWVRTGPDRWEKALSHPATIRPDQLNADAGEPLANDPQVQAVFRSFEGVLGNVSPEIKRRGLNVGMATRLALGTAKSALASDLDALALPIEVRPSNPNDSPRQVEQPKQAPTNVPDPLTVPVP
ncbi:MAG: hypothetical protein ABI353_17815 [Isosphaeraceae bacterium]